MIFTPFSENTHKNCNCSNRNFRNVVYMLQNKLSDSPYHLHSVAKEQALCRDAADLVHESVLP